MVNLTFAFAHETLQMQASWILGVRRHGALANGQTVNCIDWIVRRPDF